MTQSRCLYCAWNGTKDQHRLAMVIIPSQTGGESITRLITVCPNCHGVQTTLQKTPLEYAVVSEN